MVIREGNNSIEIISTDRVPEQLPSAGDVRLALTVRAEGFAGEGCYWIEAPRLRLFLERLRALNARRQGNAELESISLGQFRLLVSATDGAGHMAVAGRLAQGRQALEFSFEFCPTHLPGVVAAFDAITDGQAEPGVASGGTA